MKKLILFFTNTFVNNFRNCIVEIVNVYALFWSKTNLMKINLYLTTKFYGSFMYISKITHNKPF